MKRILIGFFFALFSTQLSAQDVTAQFVEYLDQYFVGSRSSADRVWDNTFCAIPRPGGGCIEKGGSKIYGSANGRVEQRVAQYGNGWYIDQQTNPWTGVKIVSHWTDLKLTYSYKGKSEGSKQCYPGDFFCGMEWGELNPGGSIIVSFKADGQKFEIEMEYAVEQGHGDKPNAVMRDAMYNLREKMRSTVTDFVRMIGSEANVVIK